MASERERLLTLLSGGRPDQVPWYGDLAYWMPYALDRGVVDQQKYAGDGLYQLHRELGVGFYLQGYFPFRETVSDVEVVREQNGNDIRTAWRTSVGTLCQRETVLPESYTVAIREHMVRSADDLRVYLHMLRHTQYAPDYDLAAKRRDLIGDNGVVLCYLPKSPYMELVALKAGIGTVVDLTLDEPEFFEEALSEMETITDRAAEVALRSPAECLMIPENISSEVVGKGPYNRYMRAYQQKWFGRIREAGKTSFVHMDGTMRGTIREVSQAGARVIEALTPAPVGDIAIEELDKWVEPGTIIWGGLPGVYFTDLVNDQQFDEFVKRVLETMTKSPRYVLGVADQVPPGSRPERIARVRTLVDRYGRY